MTVEVRFHVSDEVRAKCHQVAAITRQPPRVVYAAWLDNIVTSESDGKLIEIASFFGSGFVRTMRAARDELQRRKEA